jgi:membrane protease YdiL (CAAX protease family)
VSQAGAELTGAVASRPLEDGGERIGYLEHSSSPLVSLIFVAPLILIYELGTRTALPVAAEGHAAVNGAQHVIAFNLLQQFFALFGATGRSLPALAVVGILLAWHVARQDRWRVRWQTLGAMAVEGSLLSLPLLALSVLLAHLLRMMPLLAPHAAHPALGTATLTTDDLLILCLGAGIYEELVFRLIVLTILTLLVKDLLQYPGRFGTLLVVVISALMFSGYHYLGPETFRWRTFAFRTLAGIYFGVLFLARGFGVTAATHAAYDILVLLVLA